MDALKALFPQLKSLYDELEKLGSGANSSYFIGAPADEIAASLMDDIAPLIEGSPAAKHLRRFGEDYETRYADALPVLAQWITAIQNF